MKRPRLRVVKTNDPAAIFDDLDGLRGPSMPPVIAPGTKRARSVETFARFPHERALKLRGISGGGWLILVEIDRLILKGRGRNPVELTNRRLRELGIGRETKRRQLKRLEEAGVIKVQNEGRKSALVTHLWFPEQPFRSGHE